MLESDGMLIGQFWIFCHQNHFEPSISVDSRQLVFQFKILNGSI